MRTSDAVAGTNSPSRSLDKARDTKSFRVTRAWTKDSCGENLSLHEYYTEYSWVKKRTERPFILTLTTPWPERTDNGVVSRMRKSLEKCFVTKCDVHKRDTVRNRHRMPFVLSKIPRWPETRQEAV